MDACCNYTTMHQMNGKVFWVNCSKCKTPETIYQELEAFAIVAGLGDVGSSNHKLISSKIINLNQELRHLFHKSYMYNCLIVLIDVQHPDTLKAFDLNCKVLLTSNSKRVSKYIRSSRLVISNH